ncbi:hypothetical protein [Azospirillum canadense]|uniref:hypothetical protein n=1 Tax=Azospirillum canadense TaxID=403962 RepID=UPI002226AD53|nr:hypothetical protein [Azospirillum canadense]MCW2243251.1 hypothetical protein [Azospirillum canadense]
MSIETMHFLSAEDAIPFLQRNGFKFLEAPGRWWKGVDGKLVRAEMHISAYGALLVISG